MMAIDGDKKNILFVVISLNLGGLEKMVIDLIQGLDSSRYNPMICCLEEPGSLASQLTVQGVRLFCLQKKPGFYPGLALRIAKIIREHHIDIVHTHNTGAQFYGALAARFAGRCKVVHTKHGRNSPDDKGTLWLGRIGGWCSDMVVTVSEDARKLCMATERVAVRKLQVIPNGVDLSRFSRRAVEAENQEIVVGHVGRLSPVKNQAMLLRVFQRFVESYPHATLCLVGDGPQAATLHALARELEVDGSVTFAGVHDDVSEWLQCFNWFALSSLSEGIPLAVLEAMSVGMPVVATDVGGLREIVVEGETGFLVPSRNEDAMLERWLELAANPSLVQSMSIRATALAERDWNLRSMVDRYEHTYEQVLGEEKLRCAS